MKLSKVITVVVVVIASLFMVGCVAEVPTAEGSIVQSKSRTFSEAEEFSIIKDGEKIALECSGFLPVTCSGEGVTLTYHRVKNNYFSMANVKAEDGTEYECGSTHFDPNCVVTVK